MQAGPMRTVLRQLHAAAFAPGAGGPTDAQLLERYLADRDAAREFASAGPGFVADIHDGRRSAAVLADWLGVGE